MGLLPPDHVPDITLLRKEGANTGALPVEGATLVAEPDTITIGQVTAAEGPLSPDHLHSQKDFRVGFIFLARGSAPSAADLAAVNRIREAFAAAFFALTRGVAFADTTLAETPIVPRTSAADLDKALAWLLARQAIDGRFEDVPATALRYTAVALEALQRLGATVPGSQLGRHWVHAAYFTHLNLISRLALRL